MQALVTGWWNEVQQHGIKIHKQTIAHNLICLSHRWDLLTKGLIAFGGLKYRQLRRFSLMWIAAGVPRWNDMPMIMFDVTHIENRKKNIFFPKFYYPLMLKRKSSVSRSELVGEFVRVLEMITGIHRRYQFYFNNVCGWPFALLPPLVNRTFGTLDPIELHRSIRKGNDNDVVFGSS